MPTANTKSPTQRTCTETHEDGQQRQPEPRQPHHSEMAFLFQGAFPSLPAVAPVSKQPVVRRDIAVVVDEAVPAQAILDALDAARPVTRYRCGSSGRRTPGGTMAWEHVHQKMLELTGEGA